MSDVKACYVNPPYHYRYDPLQWSDPYRWEPGYYYAPVYPSETTDAARRFAAIEKPQAWECPRCKAINAPSATKCDCRP